MKHLNKEKENKTKVHFVSSGERKFNYLNLFVWRIEPSNSCVF